MKLPWPRSILSQTIALALFVAMVTAAISLLVLFNRPPPRSDPLTVYELSRVARDLPLADDTPVFTVTTGPAPLVTQGDYEIDRSRIYTDILADRLALPEDDVVLLIEGRHGGRGGHRERHWIDELQREQRLYGPEGGLNPRVFAPFVMALRQPDGQWKVWSFEEAREFRAWRLQNGALILLGLLLVIPIAWLFARRLARPIRTLASAATRMGRDPEAVPLVETGPSEIAETARAFNAMQDRIGRYVEERTAMVGAVAHDLRTPLARLRFRLEDAGEAVREKAGRDLDEMEAMIAATLQFVRDEARRGAHAPVDLTTLIASVVEGYRDLGKSIEYNTIDSAIVLADADALRRVAVNLIDNALSFGTTAHVRLTASAGHARLVIADDGPGMTDEEIGRAFQPFWRGEASRSRDTGGTGLGLAIVRAIVISHDGEIALANRREGGLEAVVTLPLAR